MRVPHVVHLLLDVQIILREVLWINLNPRAPIMRSVDKVIQLEVVVFERLDEGYGYDFVDMNSLVLLLVPKAVIIAVIEEEDEGDDNKDDCQQQLYHRALGNRLLHQHKKVTRKLFYLILILLKIKLLHAHLIHPIRNQVYLHILVHIHRYRPSHIIVKLEEHQRLNRKRLRVGCKLPCHLAVQIRV